MEAEDIAKLVKGLRLSTEAREKVVMITEEEAERGRSRVDRSVVGKIFSRKPINRETLRTHLPKILRARGRTEIEMVGHNLFVISFTSEMDRTTALEEGPWHFFQDLMILKQTEPMQTPMEVEFNDITLWVQCHNVPLECMDPAIIRRIGGRIGTVEEVDVGEGGMCVGKYARVKVTRRIDEPLVRCVPIVHEILQKEVLVILQYEKLPEFCFVCGRVGHISRDCGEKQKDKIEFKYDGWLRAGRSYVGSRNGETAQRVIVRETLEEGGDTQSVNRVGENKAEGGEGAGGEKGEKQRDKGKTLGIEGEGERGENEKGLDMMEVAVAVVDREGVRGETEKDSSGEGIEVEDGARGMAIIDQREKSPMKGKKKNSRKGGKGWKRLARESGGGGAFEHGEEREVSEGKKRRGEGGLEEEGEMGETRRKQQRVQWEKEMSDSETAAAAMQPRRSL